MTNEQVEHPLNRRRFLGVVAGLGIGGFGLALIRSGAAHDEATPPSGTPSASPVASPVGSPIAMVAEVQIKSIRFFPEVLTVPVGTTVTWTNDEVIGHTVTAVNGSWGSSDVLSLGDTFAFTFEQAGTFEYVCAIHDNMQASVIVE